MKSRRVTLVGCGRGRDRYYNSEGYSDPTAGCAIEGCHSFYGSPVHRKPGEKERIVRRKVHPVSEMDKDMAKLGV